MSKDNLDPLMQKLAAEVMEALSEVGRRGGGLNIDILTQTLAERQAIVDMVAPEAAPPETPGEAPKEKPKEASKPTKNKSLSYDDLATKYNETAEELRNMESHGLEVEEAFKKLAGILASLASNPDQPKLNHELKLLKQTLNQKAVPNRLDKSTKTLKNYLFQGEAAEDADRVDPSADSGPEGLEDNIRDILLLLVKDISQFEDEPVQRKARIVRRKIRNDFTLDDYEPCIHEINDLIFLIKDIVRREKKELFQLTNEIITRLEDTEKELLRTLDSDQAEFGTVREKFEREVSIDINEIEASFDIEDATIQQIRHRVFEKISSIRKRFKKKRAEDQARLKKISEEKAGVETRLEDINRRYQQFTQRSKAMLEEMERFRLASLKDGLTGIYNRRAYDIQIKRTLDTLKKGRLGSFSLIVFDIDYFKNFNNNYGHRAGDKTLLHVARLTTSSLRKDDLIFRYGGDEFVIILPEVKLKAAAKLANEIRKGVSSVEFKIFKGQDLTVKVGLSMGVSEARKQDSMESVFSRADQALYLAKEKGRNQVCTERD